MRFTAVALAMCASHACGFSLHNPPHRRFVALRSSQEDRDIIKSLINEPVPEAPTSEGASLLRVSLPSQEEAEGKGIREWPGFLRKSRDFVEDAAPGTMRYVYGGSGTLKARAGDDEQTLAIAANTLIEVDTKCELSWTLEEPLVLLTPDFEQKELYVTIAGTLLVVFGFAFATANIGN